MAHLRVAPAQARVEITAPPNPGLARPERRRPV